MPNAKLRIVFAGGGSGGHVYPTLAVIETLQKRFRDVGLTCEMIRVGPRDGYETLFANYGVAASPIIAGKLRRYASFQNIVDVPKFFVGLLQAFFKLYFIMPDVIFSKGGTGALPVVFAGWVYRIPIVIHESDAHPGLTNLFSARFARKIFVAFEPAARFFDPKRTEVVGAPLRAELLTKKTTKPLAKETLGFSSSTPLMLVLGGSQGSQRINDFILTNLVGILKTTQVLHQTGTANLAEVQKLSRAALIDEPFKNRYQAVGYFENNMDIALTAADLAVTRAGSNTIFEIAAFGVPAILIPLPQAASNGHQQLNAHAFAKNGAAIIIEEANLLPGIFMGELKKVLTSDELRSKMSVASLQFFVPGAAEKIAQKLLRLAA